MHQVIISEYDEKIALYKAFCRKIEHLVTEILEDQNINYHSVTSRVKKRDSFVKKVNKTTGKYQSLCDITDIAGVRIITYFEDDVDKVAKILETEFIVDTENSIDKRALLDPDRFGYLSLHHVVTLLPTRCQLTEYKRFPALKAEIQTRSILQHAWAEIEHDLGYKTKKGIPKGIRRSFSRLAGVLEIADKEFLQIRDELAKYEETVPSEIENNPESVSIDKLSLTSFIKNSKLVKQVDLLIAKACSAKLFTAEIDDEDVLVLYFVGLESISDLEAALIDNKDHIISFATKWLKRKGYRQLRSGISIFYLNYILLGKTGNISKAEKYLELCNIGSEDEEATEQIAQEIIDTYSQLCK